VKRIATQSALALEPEERKPRPELVTTQAVAAPHDPEQLPLIRMLEIVRDRVEAIHTGQRELSAQVRDIKASLPKQRKPLSPRTQDIHLRVTWARRNGLCPCCQQTAVCDALGRVGDSEYDHWYGRSQNRVTQTWLVCRACNSLLNNTDFKAAGRSAFESYQMALRPFLGIRQAALVFTA
jgi:hypothetical protein